MRFIQYFTVLLIYTNKCWIY